MINHEQFWASRQRFLKAQSEGSWDCQFFTKIRPIKFLGNLSVRPDENLMRCDVIVLIFNLGLHLNLHSSDKQHPRCWSIALLSSFCGPWREQVSSPLEMPILSYWDFLCWVPRFKWNQARSRDLSQAQYPILIGISVCRRGYPSWKFYNLCERRKRHRDLLSSYGKPVAGSTGFVCSVRPSLFSRYNLIFLSYKSIQDCKL